jgi:hypothetical protein
MCYCSFADGRVRRAAVEDQCLIKRLLPLGALAPQNSDLKQRCRSSPKRYRSGFASSSDAFDLPKQLLPHVIDFLRPVPPSTSRKVAPMTPSNDVNKSHGVPQASCEAS